MQDFKFGGASVNTVERIKNVRDILRRYKNDKVLVVISAMGKTTNVLEKVVEAFYAGDKEKALQLFEQIKSEHVATARDLSQRPADNLSNFFTEVEWLLHDKPVRHFDYYYD